MSGHVGRYVETYVRALDRGDFATVSAILAEAISDPDLDRALVDADAALLRELEGDDDGD